MEKHLLIYTDLDGTLLDHDTYSFDPALPALRTAQERGVPVIFCSSKTRAEIEALQQELNVHDPFIVENGGAIFIPAGYFPFAITSSLSREGYSVIELGTPYEMLVATLRLLRTQIPQRLAGFSDMTVEEVGEECGLSQMAALRAKMREYDEPFRILDPAEGAGLALLQKVEQAGLRCSLGGRFWHLHGANDKGAAVKLLTTYYRRAQGQVFTIGIGDSANDEPLLQAVDLPILVRKPNGSYEERITAQLPHVRLTQASGPQGWKEAVQQILQE